MFQKKINFFLPKQIFLIWAENADRSFGWKKLKKNKIIRIFACNWLRLQHHIGMIENDVYYKNSIDFSITEFDRFQLYLNYINVSMVILVWYRVFVWKKAVLYMRSKLRVRRSYRSQTTPSSRSDDMTIVISF